MPRKPAKNTVLDTLILQGMARGPYALWWAEKQEERGESFSGLNIDDVAPNTPRWAHAWAKKLGRVIAELNGATLSDLYAAAQDVGYHNKADTFGYHLAMQSTGSGSAWTDDAYGCGELKILVPSYQFWGPGCEKSLPDTRFVRR